MVNFLLNGSIARFVPSKIDGITAVGDGILFGCSDSVLCHHRLRMASLQRDVKYQILFICQFYIRVHRQRRRWQQWRQRSHRRHSRSQKLFTPTRHAHTLACKQPKAVAKMAKKRIISLPKLGVCFQWCHMVAALAGSSKSPCSAQALPTECSSSAWLPLLAKEMWRHGSLRAGPMSSDCFCCECVCVCVCVWVSSCCYGRVFSGSFATILRRSMLNVYPHSPVTGWQDNVASHSQDQWPRGPGDWNIKLPAIVAGFLITFCSNLWEFVLVFDLAQRLFVANLSPLPFASPALPAIICNVRQTVCKFSLSILVAICRFAISIPICQAPSAISAWGKPWGKPNKQIPS